MLAERNIDSINSASRPTGARTSACSVLSRSRDPVGADGVFPSCGAARGVMAEVIAEVMGELIANVMVDGVLMGIRRRAD
jgi:hypothetical protein